jgi:serine protease inhibitor
MVQALNKNNKMEIILDDDVNLDDIEKKIVVKNLMLLNRCVNLATQVSIYIPSKKTKDPLVIEYPLASLGNMRLVYVR